MGRAFRDGTDHHRYRGKLLQSSQPAISQNDGFVLRAARNRSGWQITPEGEALLEAGSADGAPEPSNVSSINGGAVPSAGD